MKKIIVILSTFLRLTNPNKFDWIRLNLKVVSLLAILLFNAMPSQAQLKFGVKGGINVTNMKFNKSVLGAKNQSGFFIGPTVKFKLPLVGLGFDVAALYDQREADMDIYNPDNETKMEKLKQQSINVPINLRYTVGLGDLAGIYFAAGSQFGFNVGGKHFDFGENFKMKNSNFSVNVGAGVRLLNHLEIGATYNIACGKTGEFELSNVNMKSNAWQISAAYYF